MRSAPQSRLWAAISLIRAIVSGESFGFLACTLHLCFQNARKSSRCQREMRLWLDKEERLSPSPNHSGQEHQKKPVCFPADGTFNLSTQDDQLLPQQRVFRQQFGFASGQVDECSERKRCRRWFEPTQSTFLERVQTETDALLNQEKHILHK
jgi:hypothetical protein